MGIISYRKIPEVGDFLVFLEILYEFIVESIRKKGQQEVQDENWRREQCSYLIVNYENDAHIYSKSIMKPSEGYR